jgi:3-isopropylmalate/(R)-2-methylmalate dehydratase large subunit
MAGLTLYDKLWRSHVIDSVGPSNGAAGDEGAAELIHVDRQILHEVSSPQAFEGLRANGWAVRDPKAHIAVADHAVPTHSRDRPIADPLARRQVALLQANAAEFGIDYIGLDDPRHGIVHVIGPELGFTQPGLTIVCGDSHTSTHGAFGALAFGIGSSEAEGVLAAQAIRQTKAKTFRIRFDGRFGPGITAKDAILSVIGRIGASGAVGYAVEYAGEAVLALSMQGRMTLCNMSIEAGARSGMIAPDETTFAWLRGRPVAPKGAMWDEALAYWRTLNSDADAVFDRELEIDASQIAPHVTWGTSPDQVAPVGARLPDPAAAASGAEGDRTAAALRYMGLEPGADLGAAPIDHVFIGSCTNGRIEDLRAAAGVLKGRHIAAGVRALAVPGSAATKREAEAEGLDLVFKAAGFEWREAGCSLCVAMNDDRLPPGARCASTSNRNFEGRQGPGARTHLMSPAMAAAAAVAGRIVDVRDLMGHA